MISDGRGPRSKSSSKIQQLRERVDHLELRLSGLQGKDLLAAVLETSVAAITVLDSSGQIVYANPSAETILGLTVQDIEGRAYDDPGWKSTDLDGGPWTDEKQPFSRVIETGEPVFDVQHSIEWPDGQQKTLSISGAPVFDSSGELALVVFSIVDVSIRNATEIALRASEAAFRSLIETIPSYILSVGKDGCVRFLNRDLPQHTLAEVIGQPVTRFVGEEFREEFKASLTQVLKTGQIQELETRVDRFDEPPLWFLSRMGPLRSDRGIESVTIVGFDITALKNAEVALQEREAQLQQAQRLESIGRLAGGVAHDFNNLLTVVTGCADQLHRELEARELQLSELTDEIRLAADRGARLTQQLLTFARRQVVQPRVIRLSDLVPTCYELIRRLIGEDIEIDLHIDENAHSVRVDPGQFEQVLVNLAVNARDAMAEGGRLTLRAENRAIPTESRSPLAGQPCVRIVVEDTGTGLSDEAKTHAFDPFFTTKPPRQGTGLGLATCFGIISQSGGTISVENASSGGARFIIDLPRASGPPEPWPTREHSRRVHRGQERVLLVEDDPNVRQITSTMLSEAGYRVVAAQDGRHALTIHRESEAAIDVLVTDVVMPGMTGPLLALELLTVDPDVRVIFTSGYPADIDSELARKNDHGKELRVLLGGTLNFLQKPFSAGQLTGKIREVIERTATREQAAREDRS